MKRLILLPVALAVAMAAATHYQTARAKIDSIRNEKLAPGSRVELTQQELQAYAENELPDGVRDPRLKITGPEMASGSAMVDFLKLRQSLGYKTGWLMSKLLDGERPVSVTARITSNRGRATVDVQSVTISGMEIDGGTLDFLIHNILMRMYPDAVVDQPFELGHRIEKLDAQPRAVGVVIGK